MKTITKFPLFLAFSAVFILNACASSTSLTNGPKTKLKDDNTFLLKEISTDKSYGYTEENPIRVGGALDNGPLNERRFLNALAGPDGQDITYTRTGSCCPFKSPNGIRGTGLLDRYEISIKGMSKKRILYINMYDRAVLKAPVGFTIK
ncbi:MAG: 2-dehydro-3-deoxyphosphooctonate aldolase [Bacteroidia bacterium]